MVQKKKVYVNKQIAIFQTGSYLLELVDNLKPAAKYFTGRLHARAEKYEGADGKEKREENSLIKVVMVDYSEREKEKDKEKAKKIPSVSVYMNLEPEKIRWYYNAVSRGAVTYKDNAEKIFGEPDENGYSVITKISVYRNEVYNGVKQNRPWYICIENGKGIKEKRENGACYCKKDSYIREKIVDAKMTDYEFFSVMSQGVSYLDAVESRYILQPMMKELLNQLFLAFKGLLVKVLARKDNDETTLEAAPSENGTKEATTTDEVSSKEPDLPLVPFVSNRHEEINIPVPMMEPAGDPYEDEPDLPYFPKPVQNAAPPVKVEQAAPATPAAVANQNNGEMSYEEACSTVINFGNYKGKTMGSLVTENPAQLHWFVKSYKGKNEKLKIAAEILLKNMKAA